MRVSAIVPVAGGDVPDWDQLHSFDERIVVNGDRERTWSAPTGTTVLDTTPGRAAQMNAGAAAATGEILVFVHADTRLPAGAARFVRNAIASGAPGGGFKTTFDDRRILVRLGDLYRDLRTRYTRRFFGDQTIFIRRDLFEKLGGYRPLPWMEDYDLAVRMARFGRPAFVARATVTSGRRYPPNGLLRRWLRDQSLKLRHHLRTRG